ncbi:MAG: phenylalanine 4-monooxygenase [Pirellulales bacterium]|nr:phenylalanine 4-monooxygenase [Pirellulales bacterium]
MSTVASGLTTTKAAFIEQAQQDGQLYIDQPYDLYSDENQETWRCLYDRILPKWEQFANARFMHGLEVLHLKRDAIPKLDDINRFLAPLSGFKAKAVSGYVPAFLFFDCLRQRSFPTTITIRDGQALDYLPEPDIFHDVAGHVPMHTDRVFSDVLVRFGEVARFAAERAAGVAGGDAEHIRCLENNIKAMARFFWFTVEFGLIREKDGLKAYGSGLLSSLGELEHSLTSPAVQRYPIQMEWVVNQYFEIDHYQPLLFIVDSFDHLFSQVDKLETWLKDGKLDHVSPGEPAVNPADLESFLEA